VLRTASKPAHRLHQQPVDSARRAGPCRHVVGHQVRGGAGSAEQRRQPVARPLQRQAEVQPPVDQRVTLLARRTRQPGTLRDGQCQLVQPVKAGRMRGKVGGGILQLGLAAQRVEAALGGLGGPGQLPPGRQAQRHGR
jgi:hypothetical protein